MAAQLGGVRGTLTPSLLVKLFQIIRWMVLGPRGIMKTIFLVINLCFYSRQSLASYFVQSLTSRNVPSTDI